MLQQAWLIIWDEAVTQHKYNFLQYHVDYCLTNLTFQDMWLKLSTACFGTFLQQTNHLLELLLPLKVTSNRCCLLLSTEHKKMQYKLYCSTLPYKIPLKSYVFVKICKFLLMPTRMHLYNGSLTSDMGRQQLLIIPLSDLPLLPSPLACLATQKILLQASTV